MTKSKPRSLNRYEAWFAEYEGEVYPVLLRPWLKGWNYNDTGMDEHNLKAPMFAAKIEEKRKVLVALTKNDKPPFKRGEFVGISEVVGDVVLDQHGLRTTITPFIKRF